MTLGDWLGSMGVAILLVAFLLNLMKKITESSVPYLSMNAIGAAMTCIASILIMFVPFIILEAVWTLVSLVTLIKVLRKG
jgi:nucleoside recognition membrane protein YjiH